MLNHESVGAQLTASVPLRDTPVWALLERRLFGVLDDAWRMFENQYCAPDGRLVYAGPMEDRDGVDDFYEPFFNWPVLYQLGGASDLLTAAKHHWSGVTRQMTEVGFVRDEFEIGYDWFHQGESLIFFYAICAADPDDEAFKERAKRFANLYLPGSPSGNYDENKKMIVAPHTGSGGPRWGLGLETDEGYSPSPEWRKPYGLPLQDVEGIHSWSDLDVEDNAKRMGHAMRDRMGRGDTAVNLAATSLVTNAWLYEHEEKYSQWVVDYVARWRERAEFLDGLIPDNVGPTGQVGELHGGKWFGGHYGWTWPHGLHSVESAVMIGCINESLVTSHLEGLDLARVPLDTVLAHGVVENIMAADGSLSSEWAERLAASGAEKVRLVPYRFGDHGWFDFHPVPMTYPQWLWWLTLSDEDFKRLRNVEENSGVDWTKIGWFRDKEDQGHEAPWIAFLQGRNPTYPERSLEMALGQVMRRLTMMNDNPTAPEGHHIHWWQQVNPVTTEVLVQLVTGAPPALYNGGLQLARVKFGDATHHRPGLPEDVAVLVDRIDDEGIGVNLVNLSVTETREVILQAGAFGEDRIDELSYDQLIGDYPGSGHEYTIPVPRVATRAWVQVGSSRTGITLPPLTQMSLQLKITRRAYTPKHTPFAANQKN